MEATFVSPGILPPIINTIPNSPMVCANVRTTPVNNDERMFGNKIFETVFHLLLPNVYEASLNDGESPANPAWIGCTINGKLYNTEAITKPGKENTRRMSK